VSSKFTFDCSSFSNASTWSPKRLVVVRLVVWNNTSKNRSCVDDQSKLIASMQAQQKALDEKAASGDSASEALVERCSALQHALNENQAKAAAKEEALAEAAHTAAAAHEAYARNCRAEAEAMRTSAANTAAELAALTRERDSLAAAAVHMTLLAGKNGMKTRACAHFYDP